MGDVRIGLAVDQEWWMGKREERGRLKERGSTRQRGMTGDRAEPVGHGNAKSCVIHKSTKIKTARKFEREEKYGNKSTTLRSFPVRDALCAHET